MRTVSERHSLSLLGCTWLAGEALALALALALGLLGLLSPATATTTTTTAPPNKERSHPSKSQRKFAPQTKSNVTSSALDTLAIKKTTSTPVYQSKNLIFHCRMT
jgi:hypothetical protein